MATVKYIKFHPEKCDGSRDCERACSQVHFKHDKGGEWSAIQIVKEGDSYDMTVCNMCGLCIDMCPVMALKRLASGTVVLNKNLCIGCQSCVGFCPRGVMRKAPDRMEPFKCIACGKCVEACPAGALEMVEEELEDLEETVYSYLGVCE